MFFDGKGEADFSLRLSKCVYAHIMGTIKAWKDEVNPVIPPEHNAIIAAWAYVGLFLYWLETSCMESPEEMGITLAAFWKKNWIMQV